MAERAVSSFRILGPSILPSYCGQSHSYTATCAGDTSEPAFCSVAYFRFSYANGAVRCALVTAKTRAAPKKPDSFIMCLRWFIAMRGKRTVVYSDRGTNFVGANRIVLLGGIRIRLQVD